MKKVFLWVSLLFCLQAGAISLDSLLRVYSGTSQPDTARLKALNEIIWVYYESQPDTSMKLARNMLQFARTHESKRWEGVALNTIGLFYQDQRNYYDALKYNLLALDIFKQLDDKRGIASSESYIGISYKNISDYSKALQHQQNCLRLNEELGNRSEIANANANVANLYYRLGNVPKALDYQFKSLSLNKELQRKESVLNNYMDLGNYYLQIKDIRKAFEYLNKGLELSAQVKNKEISAALYSNLGSIYNEQKDYEKARELFFKSLAIDEELGDKLGIAYDYSNLGGICVSLGQYKEGFRYLESSEVTAKMVGDLELQKGVYKIFFEAYQKTGDPSNALKYHLLFVTIKDSILNQEKQKEIVLQEIRFEYDKKALADSISLVNQKKLGQAQLKQEETKRYSLYGGLLLVLFFAGFMFNRFKVTQKQKNVIESQKVLVDEKQKEILDSINYAKRIQRALLASDELIRKNLHSVDGGGHFILFKPKDIVSGDFYWATELVNGNFALVTADSTGHGVPGAIMSMLNISCLNEAMNGEEIIQPAEILNYTRKRVVSYLANDGSPEGGKDGMDCSLLCFDREKGKIFYAAANNPVWIVRSNDLIELKPDKMPVGKHDKDSVSFSQGTFDCQKGDMAYTFTDGFPDQFGGPKGKKFMYKQLKELLVSVSELPLTEQKEKLEQALAEWKGSHEQVDDILLIGIRIG